MNFAICNEIFEGWSLERTFKFAAEVGYGAVEIAPFTIAPDVTQISAGQRAKIREMAQASGVAISGIHWVLVKTEGKYLTHPDPEVRKNTSIYFMNLVDFCADLGGRSIVVGSPKQRNLMDGVSREQAEQWSLEVFREAVLRAERRGVTICLEPLAPSETNFINTAEEAIKLIRRLPSPNFKIILDVKAMSSESKPIPQIIRESWPYFAYFHANDKNLKGPGFGEVDFRPILSALQEVGYRGWVSVEVFNFEEGPEAIARKSIEHLRESMNYEG